MQEVYYKKRGNQRSKHTSGAVGHTSTTSPRQALEYTSTSHLTLRELHFCYALAHGRGGRNTSCHRLEQVVHVLRTTPLFAVVSSVAHGRGRKGDEPSDVSVCPCRVRAPSAGRAQHRPSSPLWRTASRTSPRYSHSSADHQANTTTPHHQHTPHQTTDDKDKPTVMNCQTNPSFPNCHT